MFEPSIFEFVEMAALASLGGTHATYVCKNPEPMNPCVIMRVYLTARKNSYVCKYICIHSLSLAIDIWTYLFGYQLYPHWFQLA